MDMGCFYKSMRDKVLYTRIHVIEILSEKISEVRGDIRVRIYHFIKRLRENLPLCMADRFEEIDMLFDVIHAIKYVIYGKKYYETVIKELQDVYDLWFNRYLCNHLFTDELKQLYKKSRSYLIYLDHYNASLKTDTDNSLYHDIDKKLDVNYLIDELSDDVCEYRGKAKLKGLIDSVYTIHNEYLWK